MFGKKAKRVKQLEMELKIARRDRDIYAEAEDRLRKQIEELQAAEKPKEEPKDSDVEQAMRTAIAAAFEALRDMDERYDDMLGVEEIAQIVETYLRFKKEMQNMGLTGNVPF